MKLRHVIKIVPNEWWPVGWLDPLSLCNKQWLLQLTLSGLTAGLLLVLSAALKTPQWGTMNAEIEV